MLTNTIGTPIIYYEPYVYVDSSGSTKYVGTSSSFPDGSASVWRIKKEWLDGTVCRMGFPDGCQTFDFVWDCRTSYTYK